MWLIHEGCTFRCARSKLFLNMCKTICMFDRSTVCVNDFYNFETSVCIERRKRRVERAMEGRKQRMTLYFHVFQCTTPKSHHLRDELSIQSLTCLCTRAFRTKHNFDRMPSKLSREGCLSAESNAPLNFLGRGKGASPENAKFQSSSPVSPCPSGSVQCQYRNA